MTTAPAWTRGFPLDLLKELAAPFKAEFKPHTYGAFGIPKERDLAAAHAEGDVIWTRFPDCHGDVTAAAIFRIVAQASTHRDFAGRGATMHPGDLFIRSIAGSIGAKRYLIEQLETRARASFSWVEAHVEEPTIRAVLDELGYVLVMTKISASSDLKGLFLRAPLDGDLSTRLPGRLDPADEPGVKVLAPDWLTVGEHAMIDTELHEYGDHWAQHYSSYNKGKSWTAFALHGYDAGDPGFIIKPAEMSKAWKAENAPRLEAPCGPTTAAEHFPATLRVLARLPATFQRVRFMRLSAGGGELTRHADITDPEAGTADGCVARLHIPISTDPRCHFRSWRLDGKEEALHMPERALCYIDTRKPHAVVNPADVERIHLVVDAFATPELRALIA